MPKADTLIRTKLRLPFTRPQLVPRPPLHAKIGQGLRGPLTLVTAPAGFGKTTLLATCVTGCGMPLAWLSVDKDDNQEGRFLNYLAAALREVDETIGSEAAQLLAAAHPAPPEAILTSLINDLEATGEELALVVDDYQFISSQAVHQQVAFLLDHCPRTLHVVVATRSDPPLPLTRLRARGQVVELRAADLRFDKAEAAQFLNDVMGLNLDAGSIAVLAERTEGWIAGLQMAALSMRDHGEVPHFIKGFSGTNRYILDYLLEEVLASQSPEIQQFLLYTSILERLTAPLCEAVTGRQGDGGSRESGKQESRESGKQGIGGPAAPLASPIPASPLPVSPISASPLPASQTILEYLERANLFLVPLDEERLWYRYHQLFADLLRAQLQKSLGAQGVAQLHVRACDWYAQNGSVLEAIHHASMASDEERVERFIEQNYKEMVSRGEMAGMRSWAGKLSRELVYRRPWLCIYEAYSHAWFGELDKADRLLEEAEKHVPSMSSAPDARSMRGLLAYVKSRVTAMRGDTRRAIELCRQAREDIPADNLALQFDSRVTLGYEYFLHGDYGNARPSLREAIQSGMAAGAIIHTVAASCMLARLIGVQGRLNESYEIYRTAAQSVPEAGEHLDAEALVEVGTAEVLRERNDLAAAQVHLQRGLALLPMWGKADDLALAYITLARVHQAQAHWNEAAEAVEEAIRLVKAGGIFSEARTAVEVAQVNLWLAGGELQAASRWAASQEERLVSDEPYAFENELTNIARARVLIACARSQKAIALLSQLETAARTAGRMGRVIEILTLKALALRELGDSEHALLALTECLALTEPETYVRIFLDNGRPMRALLGQWLAHAGTGTLRDYAIHLLSHFDAEPDVGVAKQGKGSPAARLVEPLTEREMEVLRLIALGSTNRDIARQLIVAPGTVKAHTASIYRKLDVSNRTEAAARARKLGILP